MANAARPPALLALDASARASRIVAALALGAILLSTLLTIADARSIAWNPAHGHAFPNGVAVPHPHPWDEAERAVRLACAAPAASDDVVFTPSAERLAAASITSPMLAGAPALACAPVFVLHRAPAFAQPAGGNAFAAVPTPPPRG